MESSNSSSTHNVCQSCNLPYNQEQRRLIILPCGDMICLLCFEELLQPQDSKLTCPFDQEEIRITQKFKDNIVKMKIVKQGIVCKLHQEEEADLFCSKHEVLFCKKCLQYHDDHREEVKEMKIEQFNKFCDESIECLEQLMLRVNEVKEKLIKFRQNQRSFVSDEFSYTIRETNDILSALMKKQQPQIGILNNLIQPNVDIAQINDNLPVGFDNYAIATFGLTQSYQELLKQWIGQDVEFQLLYRGSRDDFSAQAFHAKCDGKGPTVVIVKNKNDFIFGGYASVSWQSGSNEPIADAKAFLFSLTHQTKHPQFQNQHQAIRHSANTLVQFGNCELRIDDQCNQPEKNRADYLGYVYELPNGYSYRSIEAKQYLSGSDSYFRVIEIEVYRIIQKK